MVERAVRAEGGTYALLLQALRASSVRAGRLGELSIRRGTYVYVGSAFGPGGVLARVRHHQKISSAPRWHIDYLRPAVRVREVWYSHDPARREHQWARTFAALGEASIPLSGFGASDCNCEAHLFFFRAAPSLRGFRRRIRRDHPEHHSIVCVCKI